MICNKYRCCPRTKSTSKFSYNPSGSRHITHNYFKHPNYKSPYEIKRMLRQLTGYEWESWTNCEPDKPGWRKLGRIGAYYKWLAEANDNPGCKFTAPENLEDMIMLPYAESLACGILNSGDTYNRTWSLWTRVGTKTVDPRTLRHKWEHHHTHTHPPTYCHRHKCC